jgi:hypothetical protein
MSERTTFGGKSLQNWISIVERNRQENRQRSRGDFEGIYSGTYTEQQAQLASARESAPLDAHDVHLVIYGASGAFCDSLIEMFGRHTVVTWFDDAEQATRFTLEYAVKTVIMDMDAPTDIFSSMDVFAALKTVAPETTVLACTKNDYSLESKSIAKRHGIIVKKPLFRKDVERLCRDYLHKK